MKFTPKTHKQMQHKNSEKFRVTFNGPERVELLDRIRVEASKRWINYSDFICQALEYAMENLGSESLTAAEMKMLELRGWSFVQTGPTDMEWMKHSPKGVFLAKQGDHIWREDLHDIRRFVS